jgi:branched-chain amino acid transport system substrate-binding protein
LISSDHHDSHLLATEVKKALLRRKKPPQFHFVYHRSAPEWEPIVKRTVDCNPAAVAVFADIDGSASLVRKLRASGFEGPLFGGPSMGRRRFIELAGDDAEGMIFPLLSGETSDPAAGGMGTCMGEEAEERVDAIRTSDDRFNWDDATIHAYDAVNLTIDAIRRGGLDRTRIGEAIRHLAPWDGLAGTVRWDALGANTRAPRLGTVSAGRVCPTAGWAAANQRR